MRLITVSGPPSSGKTSLICHIAEALAADGRGAGVIKMDCLATQDGEVYASHSIPCTVGLSGGLCPDHFFISNIEDCFDWGRRLGLDFLITESAGLCNRCSPHIEGVLAICTIDNLMGIATPRKIGPMLKMADIVAITKGDIVSQAEREIFALRVRQANAKAKIMNVNGINGQGCYELSRLCLEACDLETLADMKLRFTMPAALCSYCLGERRIGQDRQMGNVRTMGFEESES